MKSLVKLLCLMLALLLAAPAAWAQEGPALQESPAPQEMAVQQPLDPAWINVLLIGTDTRDHRVNEGEGRADTIMVASVHQQSGAVRLLSLARDMWIQLPDSEAYNRINTAYRFGGAARQIKAVNQVLGLDIEHYVIINFYGFCDVVDALGGVDVELTRAEVSYINNAESDSYGSAWGKNLVQKNGVQTLTGAQALCYARIRKLDSDFGRMQRQRNVIMAVAEKAKKLSIAQQLQFVKTCLSCVSMDLGLLDILTLGRAVLTGGFADFAQLGLPTEGNFRYDSKDGISKIIFDAEAVKKDAQAFIYEGS